MDMGELKNFHINNDGSVTVESKLTEQEQKILDILRIEKAKGGIFASRRMKKRALRYAESANLPTPKMLVEKLMLDHYPKYFGQYGKTTMLIIWTAFIGIFLLGTAILSFPTYFEYDDYTYCTKESTDYYNKADRLEKEHDHSHMTDDYSRQAEWAAERADLHFEWFLISLSSAICCLGIAGFGIWQYRRTSQNILNNLNEK